ncbi:MAG: hypothetical protein ACK4K4_06205 [Caldimicrobium sp.]
MSRVKVLKRVFLGEGLGIVEYLSSAQKVAKREKLFIMREGYVKE